MSMFAAKTAFILSMSSLPSKLCDMRRTGKLFRTSVVDQGPCSPSRGFRPSSMCRCRCTAGRTLRVHKAVQREQEETYVRESWLVGTVAERLLLETTCVHLQEQLVVRIELKAEAGLVTCSLRMVSVCEMLRHASMMSSTMNTMMSALDFFRTPNRPKIPAVCMRQRKPRPLAGGTRGGHR